MGPRKRSKPNPKAEAGVEVSGSSKSQAGTQQPSTPTTSGSIPLNKPHLPESAAAGIDGPNTVSVSDGLYMRIQTDLIQPHVGKNWYGGTWSRKATPVTQVAKESISAAGGAASDAVASTRSHTSELPTTPLKSPTMYLSRSMGSSSRSLPLAATTTKLNISSNAPNPETGAAAEGQPAKPDTASQEQGLQANAEAGSAAEKVEAQETPQDISMNGDSGDKAKEKLPGRVKSNRDSTGWLNWFSKVEILKDDLRPAAIARPENEEVSEVIKDRHESTIPEVSQYTHPPSHNQRRNSDPSPISPEAQPEPPPRSWLGLWGNATTQSLNSESVSPTRVTANGSINSKEPSLQSYRAEVTGPDSIANPQPVPPSTEGGKSYGWAFWSKDQSNGDNGKTRAGSNVGELAQAGSASQSKPETAVVDETRGVPDKVEKRRRPQSFDPNGDNKKAKSVDETSKRDSTINSASGSLKTKSAAETSLKAKRVPQNLLLPPFKRTYSVNGKPSLIQQLSRLLQLGSAPEPKHVGIAQTPHRIKRALAIGIHGYFPAPLIRSVLGQPTGTSIRFANGAANAILKWAQDQGHSCEVEKVALEGEGKIAERTDLLWKLMLNWIEKIRRADFVMIACHSQGVPVAMMLVAKLIAFGCVNSARIGVCAMAGVNLGPFADYKSRWISGSAGELFDFAQPDSQVSKDYGAALDVALRFGVKIVYIGSIDDQLVSLEVSLNTYDVVWSS